MFLLIIDAQSKWVEVHIMKSSTAKATIENLRVTFAKLGLPKVIVSDNGPCFTSEEFQEFVQRNGISHIKSAPYHPSFNGLVERGQYKP